MKELYGPDGQRLSLRDSFRANEKLMDELGGLRMLLKQRDMVMVALLRKLGEQRLTQEEIEGMKDDGHVVSKVSEVDNSVTFSVENGKDGVE